jgi:asparagine synthase (glutamine-hydrolysing)
MANGLETRVPLLDNDLVDFGLKCPVDFKVRNTTSVLAIDENEVGNKRERFFARSGQGKSILRQAMGRIVSSDVAAAPKRGFSSPDASWFSRSSKDFVESRLSDKARPVFDILDYNVVQSMLRDHFSGHANRRLLIWSLLSVESLLSSGALEL